MITEENKWIVIEAYLAGQLNESGQQEVEQKMADDVLFQTDVLTQYALNQQFDEEQSRQDDALISKILQEEAAKKIPVKPVISIPFWRQTWLRAAAVLVLISLCWLGYTRWTEPTVVATKIRYEQRALGLGGIPDAGQITQFPVEFWLVKSTTNEYSSGPDGLRIYLHAQSVDALQWSLRDDPTTGGFLLRSPTGKLYRLERDTHTQRKELTE